MSLKKLSVSIIIPNFNGLMLLKKNLPQVLLAADGAEVIVVDDASTDQSVEFLKKNYPTILIVQMKNNSRYAAACNAGVSKASSDIVVLLNNDVAPERNFIEPLLIKFARLDLFAIGCAEKETEDSTLITGKGCGGFKRGMMVHWRCNKQTSGKSLWVSGGSGAFRKKMWEELGGMDELFKPAYEEDRDLCYRALKRGYSVVFEASSLVYHKHETTNKNELGKHKMRISAYKNHFLIVWKNITSRSLLFSHFLWLPYHLLVGGIKSHGELILGFLQALWLLPNIWELRQTEIKKGIVDDETIFSL